MAASSSAPRRFNSAMGGKQVFGRNSSEYLDFSVGNTYITPGRFCKMGEFLLYIWEKFVYSQDILDVCIFMLSLQLFCVRKICGRFIFHHESEPVNVAVTWHWHTAVIGHPRYIILVVNICDNIFVIGTYVWTFKEIMSCYGDSKILTATVFWSTQHIEFFRLPNSDSRDLRSFSVRRVSPDSVKGGLEVWGCLGHRAVLKSWNEILSEFKRIPNRQTTLPSTK